MRVEADDNIIAATGLGEQSETPDEIISAIAKAPQTLTSRVSARIPPGSRRPAKTKVTCDWLTQRTGREMGTRLVALQPGVFGR